MARFWFRTALTLALMAGVCSFASAQGRGGRGGAGGFGGGFGGPGGGGAAGLLQNEDVRKELDLVDEQVTKLTAINEKVREEMRAQFQDLGNFRDMSDEERQTAFAEMRTKMEERTKAVQAEIDEVLLPQQRERLAQINFQSQLRRAGGDSTGLTSDFIVAQLEMTDDQKAQITEAEAKVAKELAEKVAKARNEAREQLLALLTPEQREKFKKLMGAEFRFTQQQGRGGQGGQRGQRGGAQPEAN
jgi:Spy/CpxP family protein refolding chaperone